MKDISTHDHLRRLCICIERRVRAECICRLQPSGPHAASVKARQREERQALKGLNAHFRAIERMVSGSVKEPDRGKSFKKAEKRIRKHYRQSRENSGGTA